MKKEKVDKNRWKVVFSFKRLSKWIGGIALLYLASVLWWKIIIPGEYYFRRNMIILGVVIVWFIVDTISKLRGEVPLKEKKAKLLPKKSSKEYWFGAKVGNVSRIGGMGFFIPLNQKGWLFTGFYLLIILSVILFKDFYFEHWLISIPLSGILIILYFVVGYKKQYPKFKKN